MKFSFNFNSNNFPDPNDKENYDRNGNYLANEFGYVCKQCLDCNMSSQCWCPCHYGTPLYMPHKRLAKPDVAHGEVNQ